MLNDVLWPTWMCSWVLARELMKPVVHVPSMDEDSGTLPRGQGSSAQEARPDLEGEPPPTLYQFSIHCLLAPDPPFSALMCDPVARCYFEVFLLCPLAKCSLADSKVALLLGSGRPLLPSTPLAQ